MVKIISVSDTHGQHNSLENIPDGDLLIHCGDFSRYGKLSEINNFNEWLNKLPHPEKIVIGGNHDWRLKDVYKKIFTAVHYLDKESVTINGLKFYGMPDTPIIRYEKPWVYYRKSTECIKLMANIPSDTDILITHGPPYGILDHTKYGEDAGCRNLLDRILELKRLKLMLFGHIHESHGVIKQRHGIRFVNCSILDGDFNLKYDPIVSEI